MRIQTKFKIALVANSIILTVATLFSIGASLNGTDSGELGTPAFILFWFLVLMNIYIFKD